ncbi:MAG: Ig-like domain-containing protein [Candidatus Moranbacteria bacterium]|nr:Ig-like domain-containing protein [Candidatus Moranbacteria bacterium]
MNINYSLHKYFLIVMFVVCASAVVIFVKQRANASDSISVAVPINGVCSGINETKVTSKPTSGLCSAGTASDVMENSDGWAWKCLGINGGGNAYCKVVKYITPVVTTVPATTTTTVPIAPVTTTVDSVTNVVDEIEPKITVPTTSPVSTTSLPTTISKTTQTTSVSNDSEKNTETEEERQRERQVSETVIKPETTNNVAITPLEQQQVDEKQVDFSQEEKEMVRSQIIKPPVIVAAKNLVQKNNPKIAGETNATLKVEKVALVEKNNGVKQLELSGKAQPNEIVTLYIFSKDPIVISIKADADGLWNYELDKELADGQHEVYVTVADDEGKIVSKSEPIAFVKTAQAADMIPFSEFREDESPVKSSAQQFVLIAIIVMSICLALALAAIGFLTRKESFNEGIN